MENKDHKCLLYAIAAAYLQVENYQNPSNPDHYKEFVKGLSIDGIKFPMELDDVRPLLQQNPKLDACLNLFRVSNGDEIYPAILGIGKGKKSKLFRI